MDVVVFGDRVFNFQINKVKKRSVKLKCNADDSSPEYIYPSASYAQDLFKPWLRPYARSLDFQPIFHPSVNFLVSGLSFRLNSRYFSADCQNFDQFLTISWAPCCKFELNMWRPYTLAYLQKRYQEWKEEVARVSDWVMDARSGFWVIRTTQKCAFSHFSKRIIITEYWQRLHM